MTAHPETHPTLLTPRLRLRPPTIDHFPQCLALWSDPAVTQYIGGAPHAGEQIWARLLRYIGHWQALGFGYWVVETIADNRFVGEVGFSDYRRDIEPRFDGTPEMGWVLSPSAQGQGFAGEATEAALAWRDATLPGDETVDRENGRRCGSESPLARGEAVGTRDQRLEIGQVRATGRQQSRRHASLGRRHQTAADRRLVGPDPQPALGRGAPVGRIGTERSGLQINERQRERLDLDLLGAAGPGPLDDRRHAGDRGDGQGECNHHHQQPRPSYVHDNRSTKRAGT